MRPFFLGLGKLARRRVTAIRLHIAEIGLRVLLRQSSTLIPSVPPKVLGGKGKHAEA